MTKLNLINNIYRLIPDPVVQNFSEKVTYGTQNYHISSMVTFFVLSYIIFVYEIACTKVFNLGSWTINVSEFIYSNYFFLKMLLLKILIYTPSWTFRTMHIFEK